MTIHVSALFFQQVGKQTKFTFPALLTSLLNIIGHVPPSPPPPPPPRYSHTLHQLYGIGIGGIGLDSGLDNFSADSGRSPTEKRCRLKTARYHEGGGISVVKMVSSD